MEEPEVGMSLTIFLLVLLLFLFWVEPVDFHQPELESIRLEVSR